MLAQHFSSQRFDYFLFHKLKLEFNDGTFNDKNVNEHQLETYHQVYLNKAKTLKNLSLEIYTSINPMIYQGLININK